MVPAATRAILPIAAVVLWATVLPAIAQTTAEMADWCSPVVEEAVLKPGQIAFTQSHETGICWGAFAVIQDITRLAVDMSRPEETRILGACVPPSTLRSELITAFVQYARANQPTRSDPFMNTAVRALQAAFPCNG